MTNSRQRRPQRPGSLGSAQVRLRARRAPPRSGKQGSNDPSGPMNGLDLSHPGPSSAVIGRESGIQTIKCAWHHLVDRQESSAYSKILYSI